MSGYIGSTPVPQATQHRESFTATAGQTSFATAGYTPQFVDVYLNGSHLSPADFVATNGSDVVLVVAASADDICDIISYSPFEVNSQTFTGTTTMTDVVAASLDISGNIDIDGVTNLDVVDIDGAVNMATTALVTGVLTTTAATVFSGGFASNDGSTISTADNTTQLTLISTDTDDDFGPRLELYRNSANPAASDTLAEISFFGENDAGAKHLYARTFGVARAVGNGSESCQIFNRALAAGTETNYFTYGISSDGDSEFCINEDSLAIDFRVESADFTGMLFVDGSANSMFFGKTASNLTSSGVEIFPADGGGVYITNKSTNTAERVLLINRQSGDGELIEFKQANTKEGTITVDGSTVELNGFSGCHESSGIPTNTERGTVVSTIDELDVYPQTQNGVGSTIEACPKAGQNRIDHAKVKVSDAVGDACVYGVVAEFTPQDKVIVTSLGIGSVRVTGACSKGDLLESNGDGTAKVQSDDIVRSKTLGKITIGNSNTGVKLVSCVMYCG